MAVDEAIAPMTTEELLALPNDRIERWLIRGQLREKAIGEKTTTMHDHWHSRIMIRVGKFRDNWLDQQPQPRGSVLGGEAGVRLTRNPDTTVGIDVVYVSAEVAARQPDDTTLVDGVPIFAVEILSPNDTVEEIDEKIDEYLSAGVLLVWIIDPRDSTVTIYRPNQAPELVNVNQELSGQPHLPGFRVPVAELFA
jgi:Uma2 family endonuclease